MCIIIILFGYFIASEPQIFNMDGASGADDDGSQSLTYRILWPLVFISSTVPAAIYNVYVEKYMKQHEVIKLSTINNNNTTSSPENTFVFFLFSMFTRKSNIS